MAAGGDTPCVVVDTGGVVASPRSTVEQQMRIQTERAIAEADRLVLVVDGRSGLTSDDQKWRGCCGARASQWCWP